MSRYEFLLLDADNTLLDFDENERVSIRNTFKHLGVPYSDETLALYHDINIMYWSMLAEGRIEKDVLLYKRFETLYERIGIKADPVATEEFYREQLGMGCQVVKGAMETCRILKGRGYRLFVITNGVSVTQRSRLKGSGLLPYIEDVFISDDIGINKPDRGFFDYVASHIAGFDPKKALVVGDALYSDIRGGVNFGLDTCWLNIYNENNTSDLKPTYTIQTIVELQNILE
ncbi:MAG: YjjG family noncanonical pyrimidine nucleotidase [Spirochaetales bacterium]|nr:YjjG family noncanonical pyrimidine nucleotidase [Spirochaetales bacterium]